MRVYALQIAIEQKPENTIIVARTKKSSHLTSYTFLGHKLNKIADTVYDSFYKYYTPLLDFRDYNLKITTGLGKILYAKKVSMIRTSSS